MYPWFWLWAPRIQFPYSGTLSQWVEPNTNWFFGAIQPQAGNGELEKRIFNVASYGRQLGLITEVLLASVGGDTIDPEVARASLARLKEIHGKIEALKGEHAVDLADSAAQALEKLRAANPEALNRVLGKYLPPG